MAKGKKKKCKGRNAKGHIKPGYVLKDGSSCPVKKGKR